MKKHGNRATVSELDHLRDKLKQRRTVTDWTESGMCAFLMGTHPRAQGSAVLRLQGQTHLLELIWSFVKPLETVSYERVGRMMKCIEGQGLPTFRDQFGNKKWEVNEHEFGNMFVILSIIFPDTIPAESISALKGFLPPAINTVIVEEGAEDVDVFHLVTKDPVASYESSKPDGKPYQPVASYESGKPNDDDNA